MSVERGTPVWLITRVAANEDYPMAIFLDQDEAIAYRDQYAPTGAYITRMELR